MIVNRSQLRISSVKQQPGTGLVGNYDCGFVGTVSHLKGT